MLQSDGEPVSQPKTAALKTDKKTLDWINKEVVRKKQMGSRLAIVDSCPVGFQVTL
jgi:hypothetical protein